MKKLFFFLFFLPFAISAKSQYVHIQHWKMPSGTPVYFVENHSIPIVDIATVFNAGSSNDQEKWGLASLTNQLIGEETKTLSTTDIANKIDETGMEFDTSANQDMAVIHMRSMTNPDYFTPALKLYSDLLSNTAISKAVFDRNKSQALSGIKLSLQDPFTLAKNAFYKTLYGNKPYGHPTNGTKETVEAITLKDFNDFYHHFYTKKNALIVIVGDVKKSEAELISKKILSLLPAGKKVKAKKNNISLTPTQKLTVPFQGTQSTVLIGQLGINRQSKDYFALKVGNTILGNMGLSSLLMKKIREENGLVYDVRSQFLAWKNKGPFIISLQTKNQSTDQAVELAKNTLETFLKNGPSEEELDASKKYLDGSFPFTFATNKNILANVINIAFYQLPLNYLDTYQKHINEVTRKDIQAAFKKVVVPEKLTTVVVGNVKK